MRRLTRHFPVPGIRPLAARRGFTLVEMLVSVALVVLMMSLFAEIYSLAVGAINTQKGMAVNDQKVRTFVTVLRNDLETRTCREVMPHRNVDFTALPANKKGEYQRIADDRRQGYFFVSENDPANPNDDVLSMTVNVDQPRYGGPGMLLYGRAARRAIVEQISPMQWQIRLPHDQPEFDDGAFEGLTTDTFGPYSSQAAAEAFAADPVNNLRIDAIGASRYAEVTYFVRNGNLYRSTMLIRDPYDNDAGTDAQPEAGVFGSPNDADFNRAFDLSAHRIPGTDSQAVLATVPMLSVKGVGSAPLPSGGTVPRSLGVPHLRAGYNIADAFGTPLEFVSDGTNNVFVGRLLRQETAQSAFVYPGQEADGMSGRPPASDPLNTAGMVFNAASGLIDIGGVGNADTAGTRGLRGEELLIANVHEFDIKVFDDGLSVPSYVNLGGGNGGFYSAPAAPHTVPAAATVGPGAGYGNRFDTWHPELGSDPPFRAVLGTAAMGGLPAFGYDGAPGAAGVDDDGINGIDDAGEAGWIGTDDERPLRSIQITVRFLDPQSDQVRQLTLQQSLTD